MVSLADEASYVVDFNLQHRAVSGAWIDVDSYDEDARFVGVALTERFGRPDK
jgi:hypothetical protein